MNGLDWVVLEPYCLTSLWNPLNVPTINCSIVSIGDNMAGTIGMLKRSVRMTLIFLSMKVFLTFDFKFEG